VINFRYHVVSLTAVFLALAIGLVVGTAALNGPVADSLKNQVDTLRNDNSNLRGQVTQLKDEVNREEDFAVEAAPALVGGKLAGRNLLVLVLPGGDEYADKVVSMLAVARAKVTARVTVSDKFLAPENGVELLDYAEGASQPSVTAAGLPLNSDGVETSSALLAKALLAQSNPVAPNDLTAVLSAYSSGGYLTVADGAAPGAEAAVVVSGQPAIDKDAAKKNQNALTLTTQFGLAKPLIVAGSGIGEGNLVREVRADPTLAKAISTVDNAATAQGQLVTALAVVERLAHGKVGQYGLGTGATSLMPKTAT
jgi:Copper transport outer membrane protein, MctB